MINWIKEKIFNILNWLQLFWKEVKNEWNWTEKEKEKPKPLYKTLAKITVYIIQLIIILILLFIAFIISYPTISNLPLFYKEIIGFIYTLTFLMFSAVFWERKQPFFSYIFFIFFIVTLFLLSVAFWIKIFWDGAEYILKEVIRLKGINHKDILVMLQIISNITLTFAIVLFTFLNAIKKK